MPITYVYEGGNVYGHSTEGMKILMMRRNPEVCFEVDRVEDASNWQSVIAWGRFEELRGEEAIRAMDLWIERFAGLVVSETSHPSFVLRRTAVGLPRGDGRAVILYRIALTEKTGRFERGREEDGPGMPLED